MDLGSAGQNQDFRLMTLTTTMKVKAKWRQIVRFEDQQGPSSVCLTMDLGGAGQNQNVCVLQNS